MECKRCGHCCMAVGSSFWTHGDFEKYPALKNRADTVELGGDDGMPCQMLLVQHGKSSCLIQIMHGHKAKPEVCRTYPELVCHRQQKTYRGRGVCSRNEG